MHQTVDYTPSRDDPYFEAALVEYRAHRPAKTTGNPYHVLGEPVGDMRDNMGCQNRDLSRRRDGPAASRWTACRPAATRRARTRTARACSSYTAAAMWAVRSR